MDFVVMQFIQEGIMHGDPHEGNIGLSLDGHKLVVYDLGNMIRIEPSLRTLLKQLIFEIMIENRDGALEVIKRINLIEVRDEQALKLYLDKYIQYIKTIDVRVFKVTESDRDVFKKLPVKFDSIIFKLIRVFSIIEGICKELDPKFNYTTVFVKYIDLLVFDADFIEYKIRSDLRSMLTTVLTHI